MLEASVKSELTHNSSGNTQPQSSQLAEPLWTDPGLMSGLSVGELISWNEWSNILPKFSEASEKQNKTKNERGHNSRTTLLLFQVFVLPMNDIDVVMA